MKITIVHQYFKHPREGGAIRSYYLAKGLVESGHEVEIITAHNSPTFQIKRIEGVKVFYLPIYYDNVLSKYQRISAFIKFVVYALRLLMQLKKPHYLYVISTPLTVGFIALWMKAFRRVKYIFEIGDLWPEAPIQLGYIKSRIVKPTLYWFEKRVYRHAYKIVAMSPDIENIIDQGGKVMMIPNMADCSFFSPEVVKKHEVLSKYALQDEFVIAYLGASGKANHLEYLVEAAAALQQNKLPVKILVAAAGSELEHFRAEVLQRGLSNVIFKPFTDKEGVKEMLSISDAVYVSFAGVPILASGSPNKFFDGLAAGKLIIINFQGWIKEAIESAECGFGYPPENPDQLVDKLRPYVEKREKLQAEQQNARILAERKYSRQGLIKQWLTLFQ